MKIENIELKNYRNYENLKIDFSPNINVLIGKNAQGKTNMLEAIFFVAIGKSLRTNKENELIKWGENSAYIKTQIEKKYSKRTIEIFLTSGAKKTVKINKMPIKRIGELLGELRCVYFSPDELKLIKESPEDRRRFMDIDISQTSKTYFYLLGKYDKILSMRNKLLKNYKDKIKITKTSKKYKLFDDNTNINMFEELKSMLEIYNEQLSETASKIVVFRQNFVNELSPFAAKTHLFLTSNTETLKINYTTDIDLSVGNFEELCKNYKENFKEKLSNCILKDIYLGYTSIGPHRDDIEIFVNEIDVKNFGSQGQQRTAALSLKLAEIEIIKQQTGETPVLILDDVLSELDVSRRTKLLKFCGICQTFISATEIDVNLKDAKVITINNGKIQL